MEEKNIKRKEWVKTAAIIFLAIMLLLTFFSNTIMNYSLPEVSTEYVSSGSITTQVRGTGTVEAGDPYSVLIEENRTIKSVAVTNGDEVTKGQVLFYLEDSEGSELKAMEEQVEQAEIAYKQALLGENVSTGTYHNVQNGVVTDTASYQAQIQKQKATVEQIEKAINDLNSQINNAQYKLVQLGAGTMDMDTANTNSSNAHSQLNTAQADYNAKKAEKDALQTEYNEKEAAYQSAVAVRDGFQDRVNNFDTNSAAGTETETLSNLQTMLSNAENDVILKSNEKSAASIALNDKKAELTVLETTLNAKKSEVNTADSIVALLKQVELAQASLAVQNNALATAQSELSKLQGNIQTEISLTSQKAELDALKEKLEEMKKKSVGGVIEAPTSGTVSGIAHVAGEGIMAGETVAVIQPEGKGYSLSFSVTKKQASSLSVGDKGEISNGWYYSDVVATLVSIKPDTSDPSNSKKLTFNLEGDVTTGQSLTIAVGQKSSNYDYTVPNNAVREDKNGKYILILEQKSSPLGNRYFAVRKDVEVISSDDRRSAVKGDLYAYDFVVTTSTKPIEEGQQVRLADR